MHIFALGKIRRRQVYLFARLHSGAVWTLSLVEFRTKMCMGVLPFLPQAIKIQFRQGHLWTHKNDQFPTLLASRCGTECRSKKGNARQIRKPLVALLLLVFN